MDNSGFITSLASSFIIFLVLLALQALLSHRPANAQVYYPRKAVKKISPPYNPGIFSWLQEAWSVSEEDIIKQAGLDAAIYMKFLASAFSICVCTALFCVPVLLPVSITDKNFELQKQKNSTLVSSDFDKAAMGNVQDRSVRLWAYVIGAYWLTIATLHRLWKTYKHVVALRITDRYYVQTAKPEQYAVLVRDIPVPANGTITEEVDKYFRALHPGTYETSIVVTQGSKAYTFWKRARRAEKKVAHLEASTAAGKKTTPKHRTGFLGLFGPRVDSIDYYRAEKEKNEEALEEERRSNANSTTQKGAAILIFNSRSAATSAAQVRHSLYANQWITSAAPEPREVIWTNLAIPFVQRLVRQTLVYFTVALTIFSYMIPIAFVSAIISLDNLKLKLPFLAPLVDIPSVNAVLQAFLPQIVLIVFIYILPFMLSRVSEMEGILSKSQRDRAAAGKFFYFNVLNVFLGVTLAGGLFSSLKSILDHPKSIVALLSESLPGQANFFISFVALTFFVGYGMTFARLVPFVRFHLRKWMGWIRTNAEIKKALRPRSFKYGTNIPTDMLILTITFCYAVIAPLILVFSIVYFGLGWLFMRNQALNVMVPKYESGGRMWPHIHSRIVASLLLSQVTMLGYFGLKQFVYVPLLTPPIVATLIFAYICQAFFYPSFKVSPLYATHGEPINPPSIESIVKAYTPAYLAPKRRKHDLEDVLSDIEDMVEDILSDIEDMVEGL